MVFCDIEREIVKYQRTETPALTNSVKTGTCMGDY